MKTGPRESYRLYGLVVASDFPFSARLPVADAPPDLTFTCASLPLVASNALPAPVYASRSLTAQGESVYSFYRLAGLDLLRFAGVADFYLGSDCMIARPCDPDDLEAVEIHLLGTVLSCWLERAGVPALHASAVVADGGAVGFLSFNGGGKSSLAAAMVQGGCSLLTDDVLAVDANRDGFSGRRGYPQMRLWPTEADHFLGPEVDLPRVHRYTPKLRVPIGSGAFGEFDGAERPLTAFYLPVRKPAGASSTVEIETLSQRDALIELVRHSFVGSLVEAAGWQPRRLDVFARLVAEVPVKRLVYPSGLEHLPRVREAILGELEYH